MPAVQFFAKMENNRQDDGSLAFLQIEPDADNKHFNCSEITQQKLINLSFWVIDFLDDVKTKFGTGRFLVKIKFNKEDPDKDARKFFTNSQEIKYILGKIKERNAFPRKVNYAGFGNKVLFRVKIKAVYPWGVLFGGNANNSANAGFSYANTNNTASNTNANVSSQLCRF